MHGGGKLDLQEQCGKARDVQIKWCFESEEPFGQISSYRQKSNA